MPADNHSTDLEKISAASRIEDKTGIEEYKQQETEKRKNVNEYIKKLTSLLTMEGRFKFILFTAVLLFLIFSYKEQSNLISSILSAPPNKALNTPLEKSILESIPANSVDKKSLLVMFSTITLSFTVILTTLIVGVFKSNKSYIQNLLKNIVSEDE